MRFEDIRIQNERTEALISRRQDAEAHATLSTARYFGYLNVDVFDCPPFILFTNDDAPVVKYLISSGTFEPASMALWCALARKATGIVDVGANIGIYSICASKLRPDLPIHAFEPNPYAYARLRIHKHINALPNLVEHVTALGATNSYERISWVVKPGGSISSGAGLGGRDGSVPTEQCVVPLVTFDETRLASSLGARPLIKIDVEGGEVNVVRGMSDVLAFRPDIIIETFSQESCDFLNEFLQPLGYTTYQVRESDMKLVPSNELVPAVLSTEHNFNQYLTVRSGVEVLQFLPKTLTLGD